MAAASSHRKIPLGKPGSTLIAVEGMVGAGERSQKVTALVDSGAEGNFISAKVAQDLALQIGAPTHRYRTLNGEALYVTGSAEVPILLTDSRGQTRSGMIVADVSEVEGFDLVLGMPWLEEWRPSLNFVHKNVRFTRNRRRFEQITLETSTRFAKTAIDRDNHCFLLAAGILEKGDTEGIPQAYIDLAAAFSEERANRLPVHGPHEMAIDLEPGKTAPHGPLYSLSANEAEVLRDYINKNLQRGWIRRSTSKAGAPILFAKKKDGTLRICVDYRGLNAVTIKNRHPLPLIGESLDRLGNAQIYTKLDLRDAYHRIRIKEGDEWKTAFRTRYGHFEYTVMPFGLTNAPAVFQSYINSALSDLLDICCIVYLDDILIYSKTEEDHISHVRLVLSRLIQHQLYAKLSKCEFHTQKVGYLGFVVTPNGVKIEEDQVGSIKDWPVPKSIRDIRIFLGFANYYRRFIEGFSRIASPLHKVTQRPNNSAKGGYVQRKEESRAIDLDAEAVKSFKILKQKFAEGPVLAHFDPATPCRVETDASGFAISGILSQPRPGLGGKEQWHPVAYYSRKMSPAERNYDTHDGELLAVVEAFKHWRHYLEGAAFDVLLLTDHHNLEGFMTTKALSRRQARWAEWLASFHFTIQHRPGRSNPADGPSRRPDYEVEGGESEEGRGDGTQGRLLRELQAKLGLSSPPEGRETETSPAQGDSKVVGAARTVVHGPHADTRQPDRDQADSLLQRIAELTLEDPDAGRARDTIANSGDSAPEWAKRWQRDPQGFLQYEGKLYIPAGARLLAMQRCHDDPLAGHFGFSKTFDLLKREFWWPQMRKDAKNYCSSCITCARGKSTRHARYGELQPLPIPENVWEDVAMDFITELPSSALNGHRYDSILVVVDRFSKMVHFIPCLGTINAPSLAQTFMREIVRLHGPPKSIVSDRGVIFTSSYWSTFAQCLSTRRLLSTAFHPQTDGQTERNNQTLEQYLRMYCNFEQDNWAELLSDAEFAYNNARHDSTGISPFKVVYGKEVRSTIPSTNGIQAGQAPRALDDWSLIEKARDHARSCLARSQEYQQRAYNAKHKSQTFEVNDYVMLDTRHIKTTRPKKKLDDKYWGPLRVAAKVGSQAYKLDLPEDSQIHPVFHVSLLEPAPNVELWPREQSEGHRVVPQVGDDVYEIEGILERRQDSEGLWLYKVRWKGFNESEDQWLPAEDISSSAMNKFNRSQGISHKPRQGRRKPNRGRA
jgi:hypothetical protein